MSIDQLLERAAELKGELVAFAQGPRSRDDWTSRCSKPLTTTVDKVFRAMLRKPGFSWARDGENLLRR